jgi:prepilin-type N-terminal cleavage/methylation domain-containing protein
VRDIICAVRKTLFNIGVRRISQRGFTLFEIVIVIAVIGLLSTMLVGMTASLLNQQRMQLTRGRLAAIDIALTLYVSQYKRLPCPADGRIDSTAAGAGVENANVVTPRTCAGNQQYGIVPWGALGLGAADIEDGWGGRFTYRVGPDLVVDNAMDFSNCDPAGTGPAPGVNPPYCTPAGTGALSCNSSNLGSCTSPNAALASAPGKGLVVETVAGGNPIMDPRGTTLSPISTGAAYVVISHAQEGGGAYNGQGVLQSSSVAAGTQEALNFANLPYTVPGALPAAPTSFLVDDSYNGAGATHFDDLVSRPNVLTVAVKAQLGPRTR